MSECVVRMEMPKCCLDCPCVNGEYGYCQADKEERQIEDPNGRPSWCPIICQLPEGHGRLGDLDELAAGCDAPYWCRWLGEIEDAPTIVPADTAERSDT